MKSRNGLKKFINFYPALFVKENEILKLKSLQDQTLSKTNYDLELDNVGSDLEIVKELIMLMSNINAKSEERAIMVVDNYDQLAFRISWLCQKTGLLSNTSMRKIVAKYPNIFEINGSFVNLVVTSAENRLYEKTISLNILSVIKSQPNISPAEIVSKLAPICKTRIQNESDLFNFVKMHKDFHPEWMKYTPKETMEEIVQFYNMTMLSKFQFSGGFPSKDKETRNFSSDDSQSENSWTLEIENGRHCQSISDILTESVLRANDPVNSIQCVSNPQLTNLEKNVLQIGNLTFDTKINKYIM